MDEGAGDHEDRVLFQPVAVGDEGVADDPARGGALGTVAEEFAVGGEEERAVGGEEADVDFVLRSSAACCYCWRWWVGRFHHAADFGPDVGQEGRVGVDGHEHPEECGRGVDEDAYQVADFEAGDVVGRAAVVDHSVVAHFEDAEAVHVIPAVEVLV